MKKYILVDIGCIECGESSRIIGVFNNIEKAYVIRDKCHDIQRKHWTGQHYFEIFEIDIEKEIVDNYYFELGSEDDERNSNVQ